MDNSNNLTDSTSGAIVDNIEPVAPTNKKKSSIGKIIIILVAVLALAGIIAAIIFFVTLNNEKNSYLQLGKDIVAKYGSEEKNKVFYGYNNLSDFIKEQGITDISDASYLVNVGGKVQLCIKSDKYIVRNNADAEVIIDNVTPELNCKFELTDEISEEYLENYYSYEKSFNVDREKSQKIDTRFAIYTDKGLIYATISQNGTIINIKDDSDLLYNGTLDLYRLREAIIGYTERVYNTRVKSGSSIVDVEVSDNIIMMHVAMGYHQIVEYAENMGRYLVDKNYKEGVIGIAEYAIHNKQTVVVYLLRLNLTKDGPLVRTIINDEDKYDAL